MSEVPSHVLESAAKQMLASVHAERAKYQVQRVANGQAESDPCGVQNFSYGEREQQLIEAEERLREQYGDLLD